MDCQKLSISLVIVLGICIMLSKIKGQDYQSNALNVVLNILEDIGK